MNCANCGREMDPQRMECPVCRPPRDEVQVLTPEERENFQGVTIEDPASRDRYYEYQSSGPRHRVYVRQVNFGSGQTSFWTKMVIAAVLAVLVFVFLPLALLVIAGISLVWMIVRFLSK